MKTKNYNEIILDVFELKNYQPILKYRIIVHNGIIMTINNTGIKNNIVSSVIDEMIQEYFDPEEIGNLEKQKIKGQVNYKFKITKWSKKNYYYLKLSNRQQVRLGLKKSFLHKLVDFKFNGFWTWLGRVQIMLTIIGVPTVVHLCSDNKDKNKELLRQETQDYQQVPKRVPRDSVNISEADSLSNNLK